MFRNRKGSWAKSAPEQEYWLSYSDLMAALLMVFALMLLAALHHYQDWVREVKELENVRLDVILTLQEVLENSRASGVEIDPKTGTVKFRDGVLFDQNSAELKSASKDQLRAFAHSYLDVLFGDKVRNRLDAIVIEGHTNDDGSYEHNLRLSQARAFSVMTFLLENAEDHRGNLERYVTASGRSESQLLYHDGQGKRVDPGTSGSQVDKEQSRRIEVRFRLKNEQVLDRILERFARR